MSSRELIMLSRRLSVNYGFQSSPATVAVLYTHSHFLKQSQPSCLLCRGGEKSFWMLCWGHLYLPVVTSETLIPYSGSLNTLFNTLQMRQRWSQEDPEWGPFALHCRIFFIQVGRFRNTLCFYRHRHLNTPRVQAFCVYSTTLHADTG